MKKTAFTDILLKWDKMSTTEKMRRLQDLENMIARMQGRPARIVTNKKDKDILDEIGNGRDPEACYSRDGKKIYFFDLKISGIGAIKNLIHEGFHAYVNDFINGKVKVLKTYSKVDKDRFFKEEKNLPAIVNVFRRGGGQFSAQNGGFAPLFDSFYIEEELNYTEDSMYIAKLIHDSIENIHDAIILQDAFIDAFGFDVHNELRGKDYERKFGFTYQDLVTFALDSVDEYETIDLSKCGTINDQLDPEFLRLYERIKPKYRNMAMLRRNPLFSDEMKDDQSLQIIRDALTIYMDHVQRQILSKKKN